MSKYKALILEALELILLITFTVMVVLLTVVGAVLIMRAVIYFTGQPSPAGLIFIIFGSCIVAHEIVQRVNQSRKSSTVPHKSLGKTPSD